MSLLLWTTPAAVMTAPDKAELHQLAGLAAKRLALELKGEALRRMGERVDEAVRAAESTPTDHGLAIFVSSTETAVVPLPFSPRERAVVDQFFATRDVLDALQRYPMYRALVLRGPGVRLLEGRTGHLVEVLDWQVPNPSLRRVGQSAWTPRQRRRAAFAAADRAIAERVAILGRLPLVLIGRKHLLADFRSRSPHASSVVGEVPAWGSMHSMPSLAHLADPVIAAYREQHTGRYLQALADADREGAVVWGLEKVWEAVQAGQVERLWVERDFLEDKVDLVIERAALAGAHVEMVDRLGGGEGRPTEDRRIAAQVGHSGQEGQEEPAEPAKFIAL